MNEEIPYPLDSARGKILKDIVATVGNALNDSFKLGVLEGSDPSSESKNTGALFGFRAGEAQNISSEVLKFIKPDTMIGLDIGSGGNPIFPQTISIDFGTGFLGPLVQIRRDAKDLSMFTDNSLDYVFSSHCWEDFTEEEKPGVLSEWARVIKKDGFLLLLLPDEQRYRKSCKNEGIQSNLNHKDSEFSIDKTRLIVESNDYLRTHLKEHYNIPEVGGYSFFIVFKKD